MKIKATQYFVASALAGMLVASNAAYGTPEITLNYGAAHYGNGGEFAVTDYSGTWAATMGAHYIAAAQVKSGSTVVGFETFCIEYNEEFSPGSHYQYATSTAAIHGGEAVSDTVSVGTGYLYSLFATGGLSGYDYNASSSSSSARYLQQTIWYLEDESNGSPIGDPGTYDALLIAAFGSVANAKMDTGTFNGQGVNAQSFGVWAINVGDPSQDYPNQDQLVYEGVPDGGTTLMLLGMALGGLSMMKRKFA